MVFFRSMLAVLLVTAPIACTQAERSPSFSPDSAVVVEHELFNAATCGRMSEVGGSSWTPPPSMVDRLESTPLKRLVPELEVDAAFYEHQQFAPEDYLRRYSGFSLDGKPLVAICGERREMYERAGQDWTTSYVPFRDGGSASFGAIYDPVADEITYFEFGFYA